MTRPDTILKSIKEALKISGRLPESMSYATFALDTDGYQANVRPPVTEITIIDNARSTPHNTDFVRFATDNNGNDIGYIYNALFEMDIQIDIWTSERGGYNMHDLGKKARNALYRYDTFQFDEALPDPSDTSKNLADIERFTIGDGSVENDLSMTPALRRWRQTGEVWFHETINTAEEYGAEDFVTDVVYPADGDMEGGTGVEIVFDASPNQTSEADNYT